MRPSALPRLRRRVLARAAVAAVAVVVGGMPGTVVRGAAPRCEIPPVDAPVVEAFQAPACQWCAGHRGITFAPVPGSRVVAAQSGTVSFSGVVVGVRYVSVRADDGWVTTYGELAAIDAGAAVVGSAVGAGQAVGTTGPRLLLTLRDPSGDYVDPAPRLGRWVRRPRLVPTSGSGRRPAPPPRLACGIRPPAG